MKTYTKIRLILVLLLFNSLQIFAQTLITVSNESDLQAAVEKGGYIRLEGENGLISLTKTLEISKDVTLDLNGQTLSYNQGNGIQKTAQCVLITGGNVVIRGNGKIIVSAGYYKGGIGIKYGNDAVSLAFDGGTLQVHEAQFEAVVSTVPTEGGLIHNRGKAYLLDPNEKQSKTLQDMVPYGAYIEGLEPNSYKTGDQSGGMQGNKTSVLLSKYTAKFDLNGSPDVVPSDKSGYTIETEGSIFPSKDPKWNGYTFKGWVTEQTTEIVNGVPVFTDRQATGTILYKAQWEPISYNIAVELNGGTLGSTIIPKSYNIETETIDLPIPTKIVEGRLYKFMGWYKEKTFSEVSKITSISKGSIGNVALYAKWLPIYTIEYKYDSNKASLIETALKNYVEEDLVNPYVLPELIPSNSEEYSFAGWYKDSSYSGSPIISISKEQLHDFVLYGKLSQSYLIVLHWNTDNLIEQQMHYTSELGETLPTRGKTKNGYSFGGWYDNKELTGAKYTEVAIGQTGKKEFYAKWIPIQYTISYDYLYNATLPKDAPKEYNIEKSVLLPMPTRQGYSFVGWHPVDESEDWSGAGHGVIPFAFNEKKSETGNKTFYAEWKGGHILTIQQPEGGKISVKNKTNNQEVESGIAIDKGASLEISAIATSSAYKFSELLINGKTYTSVPQTIAMPDTCGLTVSAVFVDGRSSASKPEMSTSPENTDYIPVGESVVVTLKNTDKDATLYYTVDGSKEKAYTKPFMVSATSAKKLEVKAIARKEGYKDGVTTRQITFGTGKIVITFDLPEGITAVNPDGGEVISAVATGGTFEFILDIDGSIIPSTSQMKVLANDTLRIYPDASGVYTLNEQKANVKITVAGVVQKDATVTLTQTKNGQIVFADDETTATRKVNYGDTIVVKAIPNMGCYFTKWMDGNTDSLRQIIVKKDWNLSAVFSANKYVYKIVFPQIEGVTFKTLSAYSNEVEDGGTCKFHLSLAKEYKKSVPVVYANGKKIEPTKDVYSIYYIHTHYSIAVEGIQRNKETYELQEHVTGINLETGESLTDQPTFPEVQVMVYANAPDGQIFEQWNDASKENPRITRASIAPSLIPMWKKAPNDVHKVDFMLTAGAGVAAINSGNASAVLRGEDFQFKVVLLPQYSQSPIVVKAEDKVLQPATELRATTEQTTRFYTLDNLSADTKVEISGVKLNKYKPLIEQTKGGNVSVSTSDSVAYGTNVTLKAIADPGYIFLKWSDGNTLNPYPYRVIEDSNINAVFIGKGLTVDNESIRKNDQIKITTDGNRLSIKVDKEYQVYIYKFGGTLYQKLKIPAGVYSMYLPSGVYFVKVGEDEADKADKVIIQ